MLLYRRHHVLNVFWPWCQQQLGQGLEGRRSDERVRSACKVKYNTHEVFAVAVLSFCTKDYINFLEPWCSSVVQLAARWHFPEWPARGMYGKKWKPGFTTVKNENPDLLKNEGWPTASKPKLYFCTQTSYASVRVTVASYERQEVTITTADA